MSEYDEWRREQEEKLDKEAKHHARVAHMSDTDFERYKREEIARSEAAMKRNPPPSKPQPGVVTDDGSLDALDSAEYGEALAGLGINNAVEVSLSDAMKAYRRKLGHD